jgi:hypothetical protein
VRSLIQRLLRVSFVAGHCVHLIRNGVHHVRAVRRLLGRHAVMHVLLVIVPILHDI